ncbi:asparagine synthetase B family protein [Microbulbifer agarilyticus]|uniref:hypothetical protein n=1 Tax=Microbulbifer agarilyticus TaxID=260552 RepID=UPI001C959ADD|nr:hypothetical protein [Microbulbifer agarilyticus]MBY6212897.1 hypothetical protein [Microbulbifer agarilyticus]MCA0894468.1 hypothetical protein [Microbulbifer agarilyticus]
MTFESSAMHLPKQYLIARQPISELSGWRNVEYLGWCLSLSKEVPLISVENLEGELIGRIIGWVIWQGKLLQDGDTIQSTNQADGIAVEYEAFCGRFVYLYPLQRQLAAITDAGGMMSLVFSTDLEAAASTPAALQMIQELHFDQVTFDALTAGRPKKWLPFGVTPYHGVKRLLPNHRLTLSDWNIERTYPHLANVDGKHIESSLSHTPSSDGFDVENVTGLLAGWVKQNVKALVNAGHNVAHLTGGVDSRMILAASRELSEQMRFQTVSADDAGTRLDNHIAGRIARKFGLNYSTLPFEQPTDADIQAWRQRTGYCVEDAVTQLCTTARIHNNHCHEMTGTCGEALKSPYWYPSDEDLSTLTTQGLLRRFEFPENDITRKLADAWIGEFPANISAGNLLDFAYVELRLGCWAGPSMFGHDVPFPSISPFNSARYYRAILAIPEKTRARGDLIPAVYRHLWPELLDTPFNRASGFAKLLFLSEEIRRMLPVEFKDQIKRIRAALHARKVRSRQRAQV